MGSLMDPAAAADVGGLARVLLHVGADYADPFTARQLQPPVDIDRDVVLADLVVLRHVGVEIVFPVEQGRLHRAVQGGADADRVLDSLPVEHRQRPGQAEANRADVGVGLIAKSIAATAKKLRLGPELAVDLKSDDDLPAADNARAGHYCPPAVGAAASST